MAFTDIFSPKVLLVEGKTDETFCRMLLDEAGCSEVQILDCGGKNEIKSGLRFATASPLTEIVAIVRDADDSCSRTFQSLVDEMGAMGVVAPSGLKDLSDGFPKIAVYLLPNCANPGMLEDLCSQAISASESQCLDEYLECLKALRGGSIEGNFSKIRLRSWLATSEEPEIPFKRAIEKGRFNLQHQAFDDLKAFLRETFA